MSLFLQRNIKRRSENRHYGKSTQIVLLISLVFFATPCWATIIDINPSSSNNRLNLTTTENKTIRWAVTLRAGRFGTNSQLNSAFGEIMLSPQNQILQRFSRTLNARRTLSAGEQTTVFLTEVVRFPIALKRQAIDLGAEEIIYQRSFLETDILTGATSSFTASVKFRLASPGLAGAVSIKRIALRFVDAEKIPIYQVGDNAQAVARIRYAGSGLFDYRWEIAYPQSSRLNAVFVPLRNQKKLLDGKGSAEIISPNLPTQMTGIYKVRLRIFGDRPDQELPVLTYRVVNSKVSTPPLETISQTVKFGGNGELKDALFSWKSIKDASYYLLEFFDANHVNSENNKTLVTGLWVTADTNQTFLSKPVLDRLPPNKQYYWRVLALNQDGHVIGRGKLLPLF